MPWNLQLNAGTAPAAIAYVADACPRQSFPLRPRNRREIILAQCLNDPIAKRGIEAANPACFRITPVQPAMNGDDDQRLGNKAKANRLVEMPRSQVQLMMQPVRAEPFEAVERKALRRDFHGDLGGGGLDEATMGSDDSDTRRSILDTDTIVDALGLMLAER